MSEPGYKVRKLAKLLQEAIPDRNGMPVIWNPEEVHPARGFWRKRIADVWSWQAYATYSDGTGCAYHVGSYATISELIKFKKLELLGGDEVYGIEEVKP